jgi:GNAT superfamily N-acetyltransferase
MPRLRPYVDSDWEAVLDISLLAFTPACESLGRLSGTESPARVDPDWRTSVGTYLRSLTRPRERGRLFVAEAQGSVVGFVHYEVDPNTHCGSIGVSAVRPARQGQGIGTLMYAHVLDAMRAQGVKYATADTEGNGSHASARRVYEKLGFVAVPMVHYFKSLATSGPAAAGRPARRGSPSGSGARKRRRVPRASRR